MELGCVLEDSYRGSTVPPSTWLGRNPLTTMKDVLQVVIGCASLTLLLALCAFVTLAYRRSKTLVIIGRWESLSLWLKLLLIGAAIALLVCLYRGAETLLWWIPARWGKTDEYGDFEPLRDSLAAFFAFFGGLPLLGVLSRATEDGVTRDLLQEQVAEMENLLRATSPFEVDRLKRDYEAKHAAAAALAFPNGMSSALSLRSPDGRRAQMFAGLLEHARDLERVRSAK